MLSFIFSSLNNISTPSILVKINLWFFINVQYYKNKFTNFITYYIEHMSTLKFKKIKIYYFINSFENFFFFFFKFLILLIIIIFSLIF